MSANCCSHGPDSYSYETCIRTQMEDGRTVGNVTKYSRTTSRHQNAELVHSCDVTVDNVRKGTTALQLRRMVEANEGIIYL